MNRFHVRSLQQRFAVVIMKIRDSKTTVLIFVSGKKSKSATPSSVSRPLATVIFVPSLEDVMPNVLLPLLPNSLED